MAVPFPPYLCCRFSPFGLVCISVQFTSHPLIVLCALLSNYSHVHLALLCSPSDINKVGENPDAQHQPSQQAGDREIICTVDQGEARATPCNSLLTHMQQRGREWGESWEEMVSWLS